MTPDDVKNFDKVSRSLLLFHQTDLSDDQEENAIEKLYIDPLPNEGILKQLIEPRYQLIVGRRGTGKSTIFERLQFHCRNSENAVFAYVDIRALQEELSPNILSGFAAHLEWSTAFIRKIAESLAIELENRIRSKQTFISRLQGAISRNPRQFDKELTKLLDVSDCIEEVDITEIIRKISSSGTAGTASSLQKQSAHGHLAAAPFLAAGLSAEQSYSQTAESRHIIAQTIQRSFRISKFIDKIRDVLKLIGAKYLYLAIDDFSELNDQALRLFVDFILRPLHGIGGKSIKFKIAAYPGRETLPQIDSVTYDVVRLDPYELYGGERTPLSEIAL